VLRSGESRCHLRNRDIGWRSCFRPRFGGVGDATIADAVLDRLLERANRIELVGESLRRSETTTAAKPRNAK
jgi:hypothetical protein